MKVALLSTAALAVITSTYAFAPSPLTTRRTQTRSLALNSAISAVPSIPNLYSNLPWITEREEKRKQRRLVVGNAVLFRELGLPEDATYEDVTAKTKHLISLTEDLPGNEGIKKKIKIEIARDKIYQIRLNERINGVRAMSEDAARVQKLEDEGLEGLMSLTDSVDDIIKPKKALKIPVISGLVEYITSIIVPPDAAWRKRQLIIWGASTLFCLINPPITESFARLNWLPAGAMMGYRGMPGMNDVGEGFNPFRGKRNKAHQVKAMGIALFVWILTKSMAEKVVMKVPAMALSRSAPWFKFAIVQSVMAAMVLYTQTYKEDEAGKDLMI